MSLSGWFRDYLYIPLGGNRRGTLRTMCNKLLVFLATGLWHGNGLTFVLWGLWHGLWSCVETALHLPKKLERKWYGHVYTILVVIFGFALFRAASPAQGFALWRAMLTGFHADNVCRAAISTALDARNLALCVLAADRIRPRGRYDIGHVTERHFTGRPVDRQIPDTLHIGSVGIVHLDRYVERTPLVVDLRNDFAAQRHLDES
mgnify:CR=1 FL=1